MPQPTDINGLEINVGDTIRIPDRTFPIEWEGSAYVYMTPCRYATVTNTWDSGEIRATLPEVYDLTRVFRTSVNPFPFDQYFDGRDVFLIETEADRNIRVSGEGNPNTLGVREYRRDARGRFAAA